MTDAKVTTLFVVVTFDVFVIVTVVNFDIALSLSHFVNPYILISCDIPWSIADITIKILLYQLNTKQVSIKKIASSKKYIQLNHNYPRIIPWKEG